MTTQIYMIMPQPGETITQGHLVRWLVQPGQKICEGQAIAEMETEKAVFEFESPLEGTFVKPMIGNQASQKVGEPIALIETSEEKAAQYIALGVAASTSLTPSVPKETSKSGTVPQLAVPKVTHQPSFPASDLLQGDTRIWSLASGRQSPWVRKKIREHGLDAYEVARLASVNATGRITKDLLQSYIQRRVPLGAAESGQGIKPHATETLAELMLSPDESLVEPVSPVRARIAQHMSHAVSQIPHAHTRITVDCTSLMEVRKKYRDSFAKKHDVSLSLTLLMLLPLIECLKKHPLVNASFGLWKGEKVIAKHKNIHLGMAVGATHGLYVPVLRNAQNLDLVSLAKACESLVQRTENQKLTPAELTGATFTFNNYGAFATEMGVQIIIPPQSATLGVGRILSRPWVHKGSIEARSVAEFTLAIDHRVLDGRDAGLFLSSYQMYLENYDAKLWGLEES